MRQIINDIPAYLIRHRVKPSQQRIKIMETIAAGTDHPTVDDIYKRLIKEMPTLSRTTVYNSVKVLSGAGAVREITIEDGVLRYDADVALHGHFICNKCREMAEFPLEPEILPHSLDGYEIEQRDVFYYGVCPKCKSVDS